jgi:aconitate hydratase 2/2-methylisocitrate dehydratase
VITYIAGEGDISTDLLSPGNQALKVRSWIARKMFDFSWSSRWNQYCGSNPDKSVMLIAKEVLWV